MQKRIFNYFFTTTLGLLLFVNFVHGQQATPEPTPKQAQTETKAVKPIKPRRISNVKFDAPEGETKKTENPGNTVDDSVPDVPQTPQIAKATPEEIEARRKEEENRKVIADQEKLLAEQAESTRRAAADAALEREKAKAAAEAEAKAKTEFEARQREYEIKAEAERKRLAEEMEKNRLEAETRAAEIATKAAADKKLMEERAAAEKAKLEVERLEREKQAETERIERERREKEAADKEAAFKLEIENQRIAAEKAKAAAEVESAARLEAETKAKAEIERQKTERENIRKSVIENAAKNLGFSNPAAAVSLVPADMSDAAQIEMFLTDQAKKNETLVVKAIDFCNTAFKGEPFTYNGTADITLGDFIDLLSGQYQVDFVPDNDVLGLPVRLSVNNKRWDNVLRSLLRQLDVQASCDGGIVSLVKRTKYLAQLEDQRKNAPLKTEIIKLNYLRPRTGGQVNLSGKSNSSAPIETLESALQKILETDGDKRGTIRLIPGRAEFFIKATEDQLREIREQIALADRKRYRVDVYGQIYSYNENRLKDVGSQISAVLSTNLSRSGGLTTLPPATTGTATRNFPNGFNQPSGALSAANPATILGAQVKIGSAEFAYQLSLLEQFGVARSIEKPFVSAKDGSTGLFENGTKIPVIIQALNNFSGSSGGNIDYIDAGTTLSVMPQIAFDENDKPKSVSLNLRLESNTPILSIQTSGDVPAVNRRSIQLDDITLTPGQTFIFGGSNNRTESNTVTTTPGLGDIPILKNLFRRKAKQISEDKIFFAVTVQISEDDGESPINPMNLDTTFPVPPPSNAPLKPVRIN